MGCQQCLPTSKLKGKYWPNPHCRNGVVDTFGPCSDFLRQNAVWKNYLHPLNEMCLKHYKCGKIIFSRRRFDYLVFCFLENYAKLFQGGDSFSTLHSVLKNHNQRNDQTFLLLPT